MHVFLSPIIPSTQETYYTGLQAKFKVFCLFTHRSVSVEVQEISGWNTSRLCYICSPSKRHDLESFLGMQQASRPACRKRGLVQLSRWAATAILSYNFPKLEEFETWHHVRFLKDGHVTVKSDLSPSQKVLCMMGMHTRRGV